MCEPTKCRSAPDETGVRWPNHVPTLHIKCGGREGEGESRVQDPQTPVSFGLLFRTSWWCVISSDRLCLRRGGCLDRVKPSCHRRIVAEAPDIVSTRVEINTEERAQTNCFLPLSQQTSSRRRGGRKQHTKRRNYSSSSPSGTYGCERRPTQLASEQKQGLLPQFPVAAGSRRRRSGQATGGFLKSMRELISVFVLLSRSLLAYQKQNGKQKNPKPFVLPAVIPKLYNFFGPPVTPRPPPPRPHQTRLRQPLAVVALSARLDRFATPPRKAKVVRPSETSRQNQHRRVPPPPPPPPCLSSGGAPRFDHATRVLKPRHTHLVGFRSSGSPPRYVLKPNKQRPRFHHNSLSTRRIGFGSFAGRPPCVYSSLQKKTQHGARCLPYSLSASYLESESLVCVYFFPFFPGRGRRTPRALSSLLIN